MAAACLPTGGMHSPLCESEQERERLFFFTPPVNFIFNHWRGIHGKRKSNQTNKQKKTTICHLLLPFPLDSCIFFFCVCMLYVMEKSLDGAFQQRTQEVRALNGKKNPQLKIQTDTIQKKWPLMEMRSHICMFFFLLCVTLNAPFLNSSTPVDRENKNKIIKFVFKIYYCFLFCFHFFFVCNRSANSEKKTVALWYLSRG